MSRTFGEAVRRARADRHEIEALLIANGHPIPGWDSVAGLRSLARRLKLV